MRFSLQVAAAGVIAGGLVLAAPQRADACGGTFCDNLPQPMPIDQTGENILFVVDGPSVEAHIQITIDSNNEAEKFGWVIPVAGIPEFEIGSEPLFNSLLAATVPRYSVTDRGECNPSGGDPQDQEDDPESQRQRRTPLGSRARPFDRLLSCRIRVTSRPLQALPQPARRLSDALLDVGRTLQHAPELAESAADLLQILLAPLQER